MQQWDKPNQSRAYFSMRFERVAADSSARIDSMNDPGPSAVWASGRRIAAWYTRMRARLAFKHVCMRGGGFSEIASVKSVRVLLAA